MNIELSSVEGRARIHAALGEPARLAIVDTLTCGDASPGEIGAALGLTTNLIAHHVKVLESAGLIARTRSEGDRRRTYLRLVPGVLETLLPPRLDRVPRIVFVCTHNSARSQFAAALWARRGAGIPAASAGTRPAETIHPRAIGVARRHGLSLGQARPRRAEDVLAGDDLVIAVCDNAHEDLPAHARRLHWSVPDPAAYDTDAAFEAAFTDIAVRIDRLAPALPLTGDDHD